MLASRLRVQCELIFGYFQIKEAHRIVVVGGGATGTELAVEIAVEYPDKEVTLIHSGEHLIGPGFTENFQSRLRSILDRYWVRCKLGKPGLILITRT